MTELAKQNEEKLTVRSMLEGDKFKSALHDALPETGVTPDKFVRVAMTIVNKNPKVGECTPSSVAQCMIDCAQLGIEPDGRRAHLIPFYNNRKKKYECSLILDYKGIVELVRRSGDVLSIQAAVVHQNDQFEHVLGTTPMLIHRPALKDKGEPIAAYSCVTLKDNSTSFEVMNVDEINEVRNGSRGYKEDDKDAPWNKWWGEMARKTVFKRHAKWLVLSPEVQEALVKEDEVKPMSVEERVMAAKPAMATAEDLFSEEAPKEAVEENVGS